MIDLLENSTGTIRIGGKKESDRNCNIWAADLETTTEPNASGAVEAYLAGAANVEHEGTFFYRDTAAGLIESLLLISKTLKQKQIIYFHNLKFDYSFIFSEIHDDWRFWVEDELCTGFEKKVRRVRIKGLGGNLELRDSAPLFAPSTIPLRVVLKGWCSKYTEKGSTIFYKQRPDKISDEFMSYFETDVKGLAEALFNRAKIGELKLTTSATAKNLVKDKVNDQFKSKYAFYNFYKPLSVEEDSKLRRFYRGGYVFTNPRHAGEIRDNVSVYDVNSMYPAIMEGKRLPYGAHRRMSVKQFNVYKAKCALPPLYCVEFTVKELLLKEGYPPFLTNGAKNRFGSTDYLRYLTGYEPETLRTFYLTNMEYDLYKRCYKSEGENIKYYIVFNGRDDLFKSYVESLRSMKEENTGAVREFAKLCLNSPSGKWGQSPKCLQWKSVMDAEGVQRWVEDEDKMLATEEKAFYLPTSIFITSYARCQIIETIIEVGLDDFIYCDTDSCHVLGDHDNTFDIHETRFGAWKKEKVYDRAKYLRAKRYGGEKGGKLSLTIAGIPFKWSSLVVKKLEDFEEGVKVPVERMRMMKGGMAMVTQMVTI